MKNKFFAGLLAVLVFGACGTAIAGPLLKDSGVSLSGTMDYYSSYMWRGQTLDKDPVFQPGLSLGYKGFSLGYWSSMAVSESKTAGASNEIDMTVSYSRSFGMIGVSLGHIAYEFPSTGVAGTKEYFAGLTLNELPFSLGVTYYNDYDDADGVKGTFSVLSLGKELAKFGEIPLNGSLSYGIYGDYGTFKNGSVLTAGVSSSISLTEKLSIAPSVCFVSTSGDLADDAIGNQKGGLYGGFSLSF